MPHQLSHSQITAGVIALLAADTSAVTLVTHEGEPIRLVVAAIAALVAFGAGSWYALAQLRRELDDAMNRGVARSGVAHGEIMRRLRNTERAIEKLSADFGELSAAMRAHVERPPADSNGSGSHSVRRIK